VTGKPGNSAIISVESLTTRDLRPVVTLRWGGESGQMTPHEARTHAHVILAAADAAESDAVICRFMREKLDATEEAMAAILVFFREFRDRDDADGIA
jgi:hypothetical protein